jgi:CHAT domain-containing protein
MKYFDEALPLWWAAKDTAGEAITLADIAFNYSAMGESQKALDSCNSALPLAHAAGDRAGEALVLEVLGIFYSHFAENEKALSYYSQSLALRQAMGDRLNEADLLQGIGLIHRELGENQKALDDFNRSLVLCRATGYREGEAAALDNIGYAYRELGEEQKTLDYANQSVALFRELGDRDNEASALLEIGQAHLLLGDKQKAVDYGNQAHLIFQSIDDQRGDGLALSFLGYSHAGLGQQEEALKYYSQALPLVVAAGERGEEGWTLDDLGETYSALGENQKALQTYVQSLQIGRETSSPSMQGSVLSDLMKYWDANQNPVLAVFFGKQAVNQYQTIRRGNQGLEQQTQREYLASVISDYRRLADLLIAQGRLSEAEQILSLLKEQEYFDYVRRDANEVSQVNGSASLNPEEAAAEKRYHEISDKLMAIGVKRGDLLAKKTLTDEERQQLDQLEKDIAVGNVEFERVLDEMAQQFAAKPAGAMRVEELRETQGIMEDLRDLPPGTVAILTVVGEDKFRTILRTPDVQKAYEYPITAADLNRKISAFRQVLLDPTLDPRPLAEELYKILVGPMAEDLRQAHAHTLMWSLDGTLRYLPVSALYDGKQYLIENYRVSVMTLASTARLKDQPDAKRLGVGFGVTKASADAPALPWVSAELAGVIATKPGDAGALPGEVDLDGAFTQQSMRQALLKHYEVVHIASHFRFQPGNDSQSYLLLGNGEHLSLAELRTSANLFGGVQLLTLSACNTGMGDGTEVEGFGTLAQRQGAKAVVATLWPVADQSTSLLMQRFYRNWQSEPGITKLEALRQAQLELLHGSGKPGTTAIDRGFGLEGDKDAGHPGAPHFVADPGTPYAHPYYWAPFFLMGNWL